MQILLLGCDVMIVGRGLVADGSIYVDMPFFWSQGHKIQLNYLSLKPQPYPNTQILARPISVPNHVQTLTIPKSSIKLCSNWSLTTPNHLQPYPNRILKIFQFPDSARLKYINSPNTLENPQINNRH